MEYYINGKLGDTLTFDNVDENFAKIVKYAIEYCLKNNVSFEGTFVHFLTIRIESYLTSVKYRLTVPDRNKLVGFIENEISSMKPTEEKVVQPSSPRVAALELVDTEPTLTRTDSKTKRERQSKFSILNAFKKKQAKAEEPESVISDKVIEVVADVAAVASEVIATVASSAADVVDSVEQKVESVVDSVEQKVESVVDSVEQKVESVEKTVDNIIEEVVQAAESAEQISNELVSEIVADIEEAAKVFSIRKTKSENLIKKLFSKSSEEEKSAKKAAKKAAKAAKKEAEAESVKKNEEEKAAKKAAKAEAKAAKKAAKAEAKAENVE